MFTKIRHINGKTYRYGYTTGSCAAAAAKAAALLLCRSEKHDTVSINIPAGECIEIDVAESIIIDGSAICAVIKDSGDDPDVTNGIKVFAKVWFSDKNGVEVLGGLGIGRVTKAGLQVPIGQAAINPVPMQMIVAEVTNVLPQNTGICVEISIPEGVEVAKRTFNEKLGIVGGISVLGTSGLVVPMSDEAFKDALALELSIRQAQGCREVLLTPGNYGQNFIESIAPNAASKSVTISNFVGHMLHESVRYGMSKVLLIGHIGKLVKVAGGIFHTHSQVADARREILAAHYFSFSNDAEGFGNIMNSNTSDEAVKFIKDETFYTYLSNLIKQNCQQHVRGALEVEVMLFSMEKGRLGASSDADRWLQTFFS